MSNWKSIGRNRIGRVAQAIGIIAAIMACMSPLHSRADWEWNRTLSVHRGGFFRPYLRNHQQESTSSSTVVLSQAPYTLVETTPRMIGEWNVSVSLTLPQEQDSQQNGTKSVIQFEPISPSQTVPPLLDSFNGPGCRSGQCQLRNSFQIYSP